MIYQVQTHAVQQLLNPFKGIMVNGHDFKPDMQVVKQVQQAIDCIETAHSIEEKIALHACSFPRKTVISMDIVGSQEVWRLNCADEQSACLLAAAIHRLEAQILVQFSGDIQWLAPVLKLTEHGLEASPEIFERIKSFSFAVQEHENWNSKEFVLNYASLHAGNESSEAFILKSMDKALLQDEEFATKLCQKGQLLDMLIEQRIKTPLEMALLLQRDENLLLDLWHHYLHENYGYETNQGSPFHLPELNTPAYQAQVRSFFDNHVFNNVNTSLYFTTNSTRPDWIYPNLSEEVKNNESIQEVLFKAITTCQSRHLPDDLIEALKVMPESFYTHEDGSAKIERRNLVLHEALRYPDEFSWLSSQAWMQDNLEKTLEDLKVYKDRKSGASMRCDVDMKDFYEKIIPPSLATEKSVIIALIHLHGSLYDDLPAEVRQDWDVAQAFLDAGGYDDSIAKELLFQQKNEWIISRFIKDNTSLLNDEKCPVAWRTNPNIIRNVNKSDIDKLNLSLEEWQTLLSQDNSSMLFDHEGLFYKKMPESLQENQTIALASIRESGSLDSIPKLLWSYDNFCIEALKIRANYACHVAKIHWNNPAFLMEVFSQVDHGKVSRHLFDYAPKEIGLFFENLGVKNDFANFFKNYLLHDDLQSSIETKKVQKKSKI